MITVTMHGAGEHLAALALLAIVLGAPVAAFFAGRDIGRDEAYDNKGDR